MSQPSYEPASAPSVLNKRSSWNIYTVLLLIALIALVLADIALYLEIREYGGFGAIKGMAQAAPGVDSVFDVLQA